MLEPNIDDIKELWDHSDQGQGGIQGASKMSGLVDGLFEKNKTVLFQQILDKSVDFSEEGVGNNRVFHPFLIRDVASCICSQLSAYSKEDVSNENLNAYIKQVNSLLKLKSDKHSLIYADYLINIASDLDTLILLSQMPDLPKKAKEKCFKAIFEHIGSEDKDRIGFENYIEDKAKILLNDDQFTIFHKDLTHHVGLVNVGIIANNVNIVDGGALILFQQMNDRRRQLQAILRKIEQITPKQLEHIGTKEDNKISALKNIVIKECADDVYKSTRKNFIFTSIIAAGLLSPLLLLIPPPGAGIILTLAILTPAAFYYARQQREISRRNLQELMAKDFNYELNIALLDKLSSQDARRSSLISKLNSRVNHEHLEYVEQAADLAGMPLVSTIADSFRSLYTIAKVAYSTNKQLKFMRENTTESLRQADHIEVEGNNILNWSRNNRFANFFKLDFLQRSILDTYLLNNIDEVEARISFNSIDIPDVSRRSIAKVRSAIGVSDKERLFNIINALHSSESGMNLLSTFKEECETSERNKLLEIFFQKNPQTLFKEKSIEGLSNDEKQALYHKFLEERSIEHVKEIVTNAGRATTIIAASLVGVALSFTPLGPLVPVAILGVLAVGYVATKLAARIEGNKIKHSLAGKKDVDVEQFIAEFTNRKLTIRKETDLSDLNQQQPSKSFAPSKELFLFRRRPKNPKVFPTTGKPNGAPPASRKHNMP